VGEALDGFLPTAASRPGFVVPAPACVHLHMRWPLPHSRPTASGLRLAVTRALTAGTTRPAAGRARVSRSPLGGLCLFGGEFRRSGDPGCRCRLLPRVLGHAESLSRRHHRSRRRFTGADQLLPVARHFGVTPGRSLPLSKGNEPIRVRLKGKQALFIVIWSREDAGRLPEGMCIDNRLPDGVSPVWPCPRAPVPWNPAG